MENGKADVNGTPTMSGHPATSSQATADMPPVANSRAVTNDVHSIAQGARVADAGGDTMPLSFGQRRLWFMDQLEPGSPLHHISELVRIRGRLDAAALEWSLAALVERHEALRTTFARHGNDPVQTVARLWTFRMARADLSVLQPESRERELVRLAREEAMRPFDLENELLLRARLVRLGDSEHALLLVLHQIAADHGSIAVLHRELSALYEAFSTGSVSLLPDLPLQYADYACWQREHLQGEALQRLLDFWRERMADAPPLLSLPADRHRPASQSRRGDVCTVHFPAKLLAALYDFSRAHRVTLFITLLTAFKAVLHRHTGQEDIVVGTPATGRSRPETTGLIGLFANTLVLRTSFAGDPPFVELLQRVHDVALTAFDHQCLPFESLVEELQPKRDLSYDPVCQVQFALHDTPVAPPMLAGLQTSVESLHAGTARTDLSVWATEEPDGLRVSAEYSVDLFDSGTVERLLGHFRTLLQAITYISDQHVSLLPLLTSQEHARMLSDWNDTAVDYPGDRCIHQLFEEQVARTPEATAVVFNDQELSYAELNRRADALAERIRVHGVGPDTLVALSVGRSLEMVVGMLGILKTGAAYVPLDPTYPEERLAFMLEDSQAQVLVTQRHLQGRFLAKAAVILIDDDQADDPPVASSHSRPADASAVKSENLAYVIYTSGSTGRPKGVMVTHRNAVNFFAGMDRLLGREPGVWLAVTSISFDPSVLELLWTLTRGFKVVVLADEAGMKAIKNPGGSSHAAEQEMRSFDEQFERHRVTHLQCTPSLARLLTRMPSSLDALHRLRFMLVGGEAMPADLAEVLNRSIDGELINVYGPTETTVWSTAHKVNRVRTGAVDIGRPLANTEVYILDRNRQPVPVGVPGELYIGGHGVTRGYWHRPELTAERFIENPFFNDGSRLYRTGDLVRFRDDGVVDYLGRIDFQVKVRGHRIELGEIEAVIAQHPGVLQSVVVVRMENPEDPRLAAYVVPAPTGSLEPAELPVFLRAKLPDQMVPDFIVFLERLPLTPSGKVDRNALPAPIQKPVERSVEASSSLPGREQAIASIWKEILGIERLSPDDNFFDSGGRSFQVVQVKARLQELLGIELPVVKLFQYPTIRSLADYIGTQSSEADSFRSKIQERTRRRQNAMANLRKQSVEAKA